MTLITQTVQNILGGVSQAPPQQRAESQGSAMTNGFDSMTHGKTKRPPTTHVALIDDAVTGYNDSPFMHEINRSEDERYQVIIVDGDLRVFDMIEGDEVTVEFPDGKGYLVQEVTTPTYTDAIVYDDFLYPALNQNLGGSTDLSGDTWALEHGTSPYLVDLAGIMEVGGYLDGGKCLLNHEMPVADYIVQCEITSWTSHTDCVFLWARCPAFTTGGNTDGYVLTINQASLKLDGYHSSSGLFAEQTYTPGANFSGTHTFGLQVVGNVIDILVDGTSVLTYTDTSSNRPTAPGYVGIGGQQSGYGTPSIRFAHFQARYYHESDIPPLTPTGDLPLGFRAVTIQDTTIITNQSFVVARANVKTKQQPTDSLVAIHQADFGTNYTITINGETIGYATGTAVSADARPQLSTDTLTGALLARLQANATLDAQFTFQQFGSTIYIVKDDGGDYTITVSDGLADEAIVAIKGQTQLFDNLPARAPNGYLVQITGDPSNQFDNYWVVYNDEGQPTQDGVWLETVGPGELTTFDASTMPHQLVRKGPLLADTPNGGTPPVPVITSGDPSYTNYGDDGQGDYGRPNIGDHTHYQTITPTASEDGNTHTLQFCYDVSAPLLPAGETIQVVINEVVSGTPTTLGFLTYGGGVSLQNETQTYTRTLSSGKSYQIQLLYSRGSTPPENHQAYITPHAQIDPSGIPGLQVSVNTAAIFQFDTTQYFPQGLVVTLQGVSTTLSSTMTGIALATLLAGKSYSGWTATNPADGEVQLTTTGTPPAAAGTCTFTWPATTTFWNENAGLTDSALVGKTLKNLSDNSTGIITANTTTTVTVAVLAGGVDNEFNTGDICTVLDTPSKYFVFSEVPWTPREVGDLNTNPFPSFTLQSIYEVFFDKDRLGFLSRNNVTMSGADDLFNFFRTTVTDLLDSDLIDVQAASAQVSDFKSAVHWQEGCFLFADEVQSSLDGLPMLSPKTVSLTPKTFFPCAEIRPVSMNRRVFFAAKRTNAVQIFRMQRASYLIGGLNVDAVTLQVPTYLSGNPIMLAGDPQLEVLAVLTDGNPNSIFVYQYHFEDTQLVQESWHRWDFDPSVTVLNIDILNGVMAVLFLRSDGVYLETIDLQVALYDSL